ncbi:DUF7289 family protein [Natronorarus salvus]|uniref:DUF7289 family protein n=1 Tax=Natronorarus salvus TaxID=3117733 RepID=UPI002F264B1F
MIFDGERGQSEVVGVVLILGITLATITVTLAVGAAALGDAQSDSRLSAMENSMSQMSSKASLVALGETDAQRFDLGDIGDGQVEVKPEAGNVRVIHENETGYETELHNGSLGSVVYELDDEQVAFQGGGVWKKEDDWSRMISPPEYHYRDRTLTFPIVTVSGEGAASGDVRGEFSKTETGAAIYPNATENEEWTNPVENGTIYVEIVSEYHHGWYHFFDSRADGVVHHDEANRTVRMELVTPFDEEIDSPLAAQDHVEVFKNADVGETREGTNYPSVSPEIDRRIEDCKDIEHEFGSSGTYDSGVSDTYCAEGDVSDLGDLTFDTTEDNISVVVNGSLEIGQNDLTIDGDENNSVQFFVKGPIEFGNQDINAGGNASELFFYVHSDVQKVSDDNSNFEMSGVIYAPNSKVELQGAVDIQGAIIADVIEVHSAATTIHGHQSLEDKGIGFDVTVDEIQYLHVTENEVEVELN